MPQIALYAQNRRMRRAGLAMDRADAVPGLRGCVLVHLAFIRQTYYRHEHLRRAMRRYEAMQTFGLREIISF